MLSEDIHGLKVYKQVAFLFDHVSANQAVYSAIYNINSFIETDDTYNFSIFTMENTPRCVNPSFAVYSARDIRAYTGTLIATSLKTACELSRAHKAKKAWYIYDIDWIRKQNQKYADKIPELFGNKDIKIFVRSKDIQDLLNNWKVNVDITIVPNFELSKILAILGEN